MKLALLASIFALGALTSTNALRHQKKANAHHHAHAHANVLQHSASEVSLLAEKAAAIAENFLATAEASTFFTQGACNRAKLGDLISMEDSERNTKESYVTEKCLGAGAFGEVWLAKDQKTGKTVAFKVQTPSWMEDMMVREEEKSLIKVRTVSHGVVKMQAAGPCSWGADGATGRCMALDLIAGGELTDLNRKHFRENGGMPIEESLRLLKSLAEILAELHDGPANIVHNDLKAPNIMVEQKNGIDEPVIVDFGLAGYNGKEVGGGTMGYIPQEGNRTGKSDVYALGMIFWGLVDKVQQDVAISKNCDGASLANRYHPCFKAGTWKELDTIQIPEVRELVKKMVATMSRYEAKDVVKQVDKILAELKKNPHVFSKPELEAGVAHRKDLIKSLDGRIDQLENVMVQVSQYLRPIKADKEARRLENEKHQRRIDELRKQIGGQWEIIQLEQKIKQNKQMDAAIDAQLKAAKFDLILDIIPKQLEEKKEDKISLALQIETLEKQIPNAPGETTRPAIQFEFPLWAQVVAFIALGVAILAFLVKSSEKKKEPAGNVPAQPQVAAQP